MHDEERSRAENGRASTVRLRRMGIDTYREPVIYMRADREVSRSQDRRHDGDAGAG